MIQRFQTLYLLVAALLYAIITFRPLATITLPDNTVQMVEAFDMTGIGIATIVLAVLQVIAIFLYSNRKLQMRFVQVLIVLTVVFGGVLYYSHTVQQSTVSAKAVYSYQLATFLPIIILIVQSIAFLRIRADHRLVRSMDRLR